MALPVAQHHNKLAEYIFRYIQTYNASLPNPVARNLFLTCTLHRPTMYQTVILDLFSVLRKSDIVTADIFQNSKKRSKY